MKLIGLNELSIKFIVHFKLIHLIQWTNGLDHLIHLYYMNEMDWNTFNLQSI